MNIDIICAPSKDHPSLVTIRHTPENKRDERAIKSLSKLLRGMSVIFTTPIIEKKECLSLMFTAHNKK